MDAMEGMEDFFGYSSLIDETQFPNFLWSNPTPLFAEIEFSANSGVAAASQTQEKECPRKRYVLIFNFHEKDCCFLMIRVPSQL